MKNSMIIVVAMLIAGNMLAADLKDDVKAAAKKLTEAGYAWKTTTEMPFGGQSRSFTTEGKVNADGVIMLSMERGQTTTEAILKGEKGVIKTEDGWKTFEEISSDNQNRSRFIVRSLQGYKVPAAEVAQLVDSVKELKKSDAVISGDLTEDGAKKLLTFRTARAQGGGNAPEAKDAKGSIKIWITDGKLVKYEVEVQGKFTSPQDNQEREITRKTTTEIKDAGSVKFEVPEAVKSKL